MNHEVMDSHLFKRGPKEHEVRDQIVSAATKYFSEYGYEKTTISNLAKSIGFSKAYIYKFFESKQAIGEFICANCLLGIENDVKKSLKEVSYPPEKIRILFKSIVEASLRLFVQDHKLYEIATSAAREQWTVTVSYELRIKSILHEIIFEGRQSGDFEKKTPIDEVVEAIYLVMRPYLSPLLLHHSIQFNVNAPHLLATLVLRSLSP